MARLFIAWITNLEDMVGLLHDLSDERLFDALKQYGESFEAKTEEGIYRQLFDANWTTADSISRFA